ncbi:MAG: cation diffusion facilitator family transporter [Acidobacteria bacterium]|nr:cation diffusion facilitator family transporter [Acidobacteriota bacterium]MCZ6752868.1 cation diffusion facilitator family transporter [Acidobacteriota bacterium]
MHVHEFNTHSVLKYSIFVMLALALAEAVAGYLTNSLALLSDAGHNFTDSLALLLAWFAVYLQTKPADETKTYGYHRAGVLAAFVNALTLIGIALYIFYEAYHRLRNPSPVNAEWMMVVAAVGFLVDAGVSYALYRGSRRDINVRSAFLHTAGDAVSTGGIVIGGWLIQRTGWQQIDPILSLLIGGLILWTSVDIIRETLNILLEGLPRGLRLGTVVKAMLRVEGVEGIHDVHIWSLGSNTHAMSCHVGIADIPPSASEEILKQINSVLEREFHISHTTIQFEHVVCDINQNCYLPSSVEVASELPKRG